jgi:hypothetical protein
MPNPVIEQHAGVMLRSHASFSAPSNRWRPKRRWQRSGCPVALGQILTAPALSPPDAASRDREYPLRLFNIGGLW